MPYHLATPHRLSSHADSFTLSAPLRKRVATKSLADLRLVAKRKIKRQSNVCVSKLSFSADFVLAGVAGFEPTNVGVRVQCLTAWRHPIGLENFIVKGLCPLLKFGRTLIALGNTQRDFPSGLKGARGENEF